MAANLEKILEEKKSIYEAPLKYAQLEDDPSQLEVEIHKVKKSICGRVGQLKEFVNGYVDSWLNVEKNIITKYDAIVAPSERTFATAGPVVISTLGGMILARNRGFFLRFLFPAVFGTAAFCFAYPETSRRGYHMALAYAESNESLKPLRERVEAIQKSLKDSTLNIFK